MLLPLTTVNYSKQSFLAVTACLLLAAGCARNTPAPVYEVEKLSKREYSHKKNFSSESVKKQLLQSRHRKNKITRKLLDKKIINPLPQRYIVKLGDTLFSIAWYHALDYKELIRLNRLKGHTIYPGQSLKLQAAADEEYFNSKTPLLDSSRKGLTTSGRASNSQLFKGADIKKYSVRAIKSKKDYSVANGSTSSFGRLNKKGSNRRQGDKQRNVSKNYKRAGGIYWIWPSDGSIVQTFSPRTHASRGLDIAGKKGQPVRASASGRVVYKGNGLRGYGNLLIIKHNEDYLSAYAHNHKIYVEENEYVKVGQRVADIGSSGTQKDKLHFEIRYKGKPVDPLNYLPKK